MDPNIYKASLKNLARIRALISKSARILQSPYYKQSEIETALELVSGIEELISAGSFFVAEYQNSFIGCGGWTIDASDAQKAEIRGFFVHPDCARRGVATRLLAACENECLHKGIQTLYLTATLSGEPFYKKCGFSELERFRQGLSNGESFELVKMAKEIQRIEA
ncbi:MULTISPECIES: GNAT family N-acetyltransferase [Methylomicrobium]|uniref:Acetyltransferase, N-acetylglutamate synthase n=1 Tax=Methylomicrobium album BG8 TaxID=686340 RepID=H8GN00_METAL|nr:MULTISPECIES: GNAT family N-acetyltransferase [Methylomicrobium]EIC30714.1 acetyltransferase, N-acetylglutamate synthase [Methylomicrobium album BG8]